jgi:hypothetical protein
VLRPPQFANALKALHIRGTDAEYDQLFEAWDLDASGSIAYTELLAAMHAGRRYDSFQVRRAGPPLPPLLVCTHATPLSDNVAFIEDVGLLVRAAAAGRTLPRFVPLGKWRTGERLVACDASGAPHEARLLPITSVWRAVFADAAPAPLWCSHTPGGLFALSYDAVMRTRDRGETARAFYVRVLEANGLKGLSTPAADQGAAADAPPVADDPIAAHALERLARYLFVEEG